MICDNEGVTKQQPNRALYFHALRRMSPEQRLAKAFELSEFARDLFFSGLRSQFPQLCDRDLHKLALRRLEKCHNRRS